MENSLACFTLALIDKCKINNVRRIYCAISFNIKTFWITDKISVKWQTLSLNINWNNLFIRKRVNIRRLSCFHHIFFNFRNFYKQICRHFCTYNSMFGFRRIEMTHMCWIRKRQQNCLHIRVCFCITFRSNSPETSVDTPYLFKCETLKIKTPI